MLFRCFFQIGTKEFNLTVLLRCRSLIRLVFPFISASFVGLFWDDVKKLEFF
jgi:hypothetical protein